MTRETEHSTYVTARWTRTAYGYRSGRIELHLRQRTEPVWGAYGPLWDVYVDGALVCEGCPDLKSAKLRGLRGVETR